MIVHQVFLLFKKSTTFWDNPRICFRTQSMKAEAYKGHCVLCKDVLSFVFQTFYFQVLCFGFRVVCPVLLNDAMET